MELLDEELNINSYIEGQKDLLNRITCAFEEPSCFTCKHAFIIEDTSVGIWPGLEECEKFPDKFPPDDDSELDEEEYAYQCGGWEPDWKSFMGW